MLPFLNKIDGNGVVHILLSKLRTFTKRKSSAEYNIVSQNTDDSEDDTVTITKYNAISKHQAKNKYSYEQLEYKKLQKLIERLNTRLHSIETKLNKLTRDVRYNKRL